MAVVRFLTPTVEEPKVPVRRWLILQAELLRDAASRGVPAATAVLRFAGLMPDAPGGDSNLDRVLDVDSARLAIAKDHWYRDLADALARCGARIDNLCFAAALGDLDAVRGYFDTDGRLRDDVPPIERIGTRGPELAPDRIIEYALIWAAAHDRRQVVEYLLTKNPDLRVREPCFHATALGAARYFENRALVALLEPVTDED